jgi:AraC-like DNA-binding protein
MKNIKTIKDQTHVPWQLAQSAVWEVNGLTIGHATSIFADCSTYFTSNNKDCIRFHFGIKGDYRFTFGQISKSYDLIGGHHNLLYSNGLDLEIQNKSTTITTFGIEIPKMFFLDLGIGESKMHQNFIKDIIEDKSTIYTDRWGPMTIPIQKIIDEIILSPYHGILQNTFLLAKTLELLVLCLDLYQNTNNDRSSVLKGKYDKEKVNAARDFINDRISNPPNLSEVAREVGLNEFKLKYGFKEIFNNTPFGYLTERRLHIAKQYLKDTQKTTSEIAHELGYSSPQHFHHQFKKAFGVTPNYVRNNP